MQPAQCGPCGLAHTIAAWLALCLVLSKGAFACSLSQRAVLTTASI